MRKYKLNINEKTHTVDVKSFSSSEAELVVNGKPVTVKVDEVESKLSKPASRKVAAAKPVASSAPVAAAAPGDLAAPIPGAIKEIFVKEGDAVKAGQEVIIMEAMKMENKLQASADGTVKEVKVKAGDSVGQGEVLLVIT